MSLVVNKMAETQAKMAEAQVKLAKKLDVQIWRKPGTIETINFYKIFPKLPCSYAYNLQLTIHFSQLAYFNICTQMQSVYLQIGEQ